jgi:hypothetical protein
MHALGQDKKKKRNYKELMLWIRGLNLDVFDLGWNLGSIKYSLWDASHCLYH